MITTTFKMDLIRASIGIYRLIIQSIRPTTTRTIIKFMSDMRIAPAHLRTLNIYVTFQVNVDGPIVCPGAFVRSRGVHPLSTCCVAGATTFGWLALLRSNSCAALEPSKI